MSQKRPPMSERKKRRIRLIAAGGALLAAGTVLAGIVFNDAIVFFVPPSDLVAQAAAGEISSERRIRVGGLVAEGSVQYGGDTFVAFEVTDGATAVPVEFRGVLPDLFREGQGVVAEGYWRGERFEAVDILARHDESYMPKEVVEALKQSGEWRPESGTAPGTDL